VVALPRGRPAACHSDHSPPIAEGGPFSAFLR
jgi:hypothetical protein